LDQEPEADREMTSETRRADGGTPQSMSPSAGSISSTQQGWWNASLDFA